jgi:hypothetical protein
MVLSVTALVELPVHFGECIWTLCRNAVLVAAGEVGEISPIVGVETKEETNVEATRTSGS